ncbi:MAG: hypothetical protein RIR02_628 [Pseudomonadota bacterium]|jgi:hypothetical protein
MTKPFILAIVFGAFGLLGTFGLFQSRPTHPPSAEQIAHVNEPAAKRTLVALESAKAVLEKVQFPETLQWKKVHVTPDASVACIEYNSQKVTGEIEHEYLVFTPEKTSDSPSDWNNNCRGATYNLKSITSYLQWPIKETE